MPFYFNVCNPNFRLDFLEFEFQTEKKVSKIQTVWKRAATELSEIQTTSDIRHSLYFVIILNHPKSLLFKTIHIYFSDNLFFDVCLI